MAHARGEAVSREGARQGIIAAVVYALADLSVRGAGGMPLGLGLEDPLPPVLGLCVGPCAVVGACAGRIVSELILRTAWRAAALAVACILIVGSGMWRGWYGLAARRRPQLKRTGDHARYVALLCALSGVCGLLAEAAGEDAWAIALSYAVSGCLVGVPLIILLGSVLCASPVLPGGARLEDDASFEIGPGHEGLEDANEIIEELAARQGAGMRRAIEAQSCVEELCARVAHASPDAVVRVRVRWDDAISIRLTWRGARHDPLRIGKDEDALSVAGLKIVRHRALRTSFRYRDGEDRVHIVI